jgi:hypothetical protein
LEQLAAQVAQAVAMAGSSLDQFGSAYLLIAAPMI